jgi:hypothetical protein
MSSPKTKSRAKCSRRVGYEFGIAVYGKAPERFRVRELSACQETQHMFTRKLGFERICNEILSK